MTKRLDLPFRALQVALGLAATLAGLDKFFNVLADWGAYVSPTAAAVLPFSVGTFMGIVGIIEMAVGLTILLVSPRVGGYIASAWLVLVAINLTAGGHFDIAVRDVVMAVAAFALARVSEVKEAATAAAPAGKRGVLLASVAAFGMLHAVPSPAMAQTAQHHEGVATTAAAGLRQDMRDLWTDHVIWTRGYIVAAVADQPDAAAAATRLLKNQDDIGAAIATFYGKAAGDQLTKLLKEHIMIAVDLIKHAKSGDKAAYAATNAKWAKNGDDIADVLSNANPNWPRETLRQMMKIDAVYDHILAMSDALTEGIIKQFPAKFPPR